MHLLVESKGHITNRKIISLENLRQLTHQFANTVRSFAQSLKA